MRALLLDSGSLVTIVVVALCVLVAVAFLYGVLRKFSRMSWLGWQTAVLFALSLLAGLVPKEGGNGVVTFCLAAGALIGAIALVFFLGALLRKPFLALEVGGTGGRVFNRLVGGFTAVFNIAVFFAIFGGLALVIMQPFNIAALDVAYQNPLWTNFFGAHAFDLFFVFCFALVLRWGYRMGFLRVIVTITALGLTFLAVFLAMYMTLQVPFLAQFAQWMAGRFRMNSIAAGWIGFGIVSFITAFVLLLVVGLITFLLNLLLKLGGKSRVFGAFDGLLFALIACAVLLVVVCGFNFGVSYLITAAADGSLSNIAGGAEQLKPVIEAIAKVAQGFEDAIVSSPLSRIFYEFNPLALMFK